MQPSLIRILILWVFLSLASASPTRTRTRTGTHTPTHTRTPTHTLTHTPTVTRSLKPTKSPVQAVPDPPELEKVLIEPELSDRFVRYTTFAAASAPLECPHPPLGTTEIGYINDTSTDTQARFFQDDVAKERIVAFPGTRTLQDQQDDDNFTKVTYDSIGVTWDDCKVHGGFLNAWNSIANATNTILTKALEDSPDYNVILTGHSLGGAIASFAYSSFNGLGVPIQAAYTQGQPRVSDQNWEDHIGKISGASDTDVGNFYRVTHADDPFPGWPSTWWGERHSRTEFWQEREYVQNASTTWRCFGQEPTDCSNAHQNSSETSDHNLYSNVSFYIAEYYCRQHKQRIMNV